MVVAAANGVGGDGAPLGGGEREPEKGGRRHGESARPGRVRGVADRVQGDERKQEVARGSRRWPRPLGRAPRLGPSGEEEDDRGSGDGLGRAGPGRWAPGKLGRWPGGLLSLSFISSFLFLFSVVCFDLVLDTKSFFINPENNCGH